MTRDSFSAFNQVALLATGDEICNGDILNSNSQEIAHRLFSHGIHIGTHITAPDNLTEIKAAILFLLQKHQALIIIGGLGPTSDDLTRQALSKALQRPLIFDETAWQAIVARLQRLGFHPPPESNKQQALFPEGSTLIPNPNGTAAGCQIKQTFTSADKHSDQFIFMLPGPPAECLPMFDAAVLPTLKSNHFQEILYYEKWMLLGISEAQIAEELDALIRPFDCVTGYRFCYPYIEFKIYSNNQADFSTFLPLIEKAIAPYIIGNGKLMASNLLKKTISTLNTTLEIVDSATGGLLESILKTPDTNSCLYFSSHLELHTDLQVKISGLAEFWKKEKISHTLLDISIQTHNQKQAHQISIPYRNDQVKYYAVEVICRQIYVFLAASSLNLK
ncbi:MAG: cinA [Gammaproteobacteria bacterium]|jgi:nicotinamide-nucleotide amidase|nr:cinA [Gammaproteobacteria bacterium]